MPKIGAVTLAVFLLAAVVVGTLVGTMSSSASGLLRAQVGDAEAAALPSPTSVWSPPADVGAVPGAVPIAPPAPGGPGTCVATYTVRTMSVADFDATVTVTNTGTTPLPAWAVNLVFGNLESLTGVVGATWTPGQPAQQTIYSDPVMGVVAPGQSVEFIVTGTGQAAPLSYLDCTAL